MLDGIAITMKVPINERLKFGLLASYLMLFLVFTYLQELFNVRVYISALYMFLFGAWIIKVLWRYGRTDFKIPSILVICSLGSILLANGYRITTLYTDPFSDLFDSDDVVTPIFILFVMQGQFFFNFAFSILIGDVRQQQIRDLADRDPLTQCWNRRALKSHFKFLQSQKENIHYSLIMIDFDNFKTVNDHGGHALGDEWIIKIVGIIQSKIRTSDRLVRMGGDEFCLFMEGTRPANAESLGEHILNAILAESMIVDGDKMQMSISMGVSSSDSTKPPLESILMVADEALYDVKKQGGGFLKYRRGAVSS